jgi:hypothetical protein
MSCLTHLPICHLTSVHVLFIKHQQNALSLYHFIIFPCSLTFWISRLTTSEYINPLTSPPKPCLVCNTTTAIGSPLQLSMPVWYKGRSCFAGFLLTQLENLQHFSNLCDNFHGRTYLLYQAWRKGRHCHTISRVWIDNVDDIITRLI